MSFLPRIRSWFSAESVATVFPPDTSLLARKEFVPENFVHGVEILNDSTTTMLFVIDVLVKHFAMKKGDAITTMALIHAKGGALIPVSTREQAERIARDVTAEARSHNYPFVCRAVSTQ